VSTIARHPTEKAQNQEYKPVKGHVRIVIRSIITHIMTVVLSRQNARSHIKSSQEMGTPSVQNPVKRTSTISFIIPHVAQLVQSLTQ